MAFSSAGPQLSHVAGAIRSRTTAPQNHRTTEPLGHNDVDSATLPWKFWRHGVKGSIQDRPREGGIQVQLPRLLYFLHFTLQNRYTLFLHSTLRRYYQPALLSKQGRPLPAPRSSHDAALTAFAQLGAQRLNAQRGIISLVGRKHVYVIAEATRTIPLRPNGIHQGNETLWKGETVVPRSEAPCAVAVDHFTAVTGSDRDHLLVNDLSADERFTQMGPVAGSPFMRFYVSVPLLTAEGSVLGAFCVVDNHPRPVISAAEMEFMKDMSSIIMAHLEAKRAAQQHQRAQRMIRGLGLYVEGKSSLREWWLHTGHKIDNFEVNDKIQRGESLSQQADEQFGSQESPPPLARAAVASISSPLARGSVIDAQSSHKPETKSIPTRGRRHYGHDDLSDSATISGIQSDTPETSFTTEPAVSNPTPTLEASTTYAEPFSYSSHITSKYASDQPDDTAGTRLQEAVLFSELKESFSRASNLIRESIGVEGALFLDASVGTFGGSSTRAGITFAGPTARNNQSERFVTSSSDETQQSSSGSKASTPQKTCGILGYSTSTRSSLNMYEPSDIHLSVPESFLRKLLLRYPHGKVFNFEEDESLSNSEDDLRSHSPNSAGINNRDAREAAENAHQYRRKKRKLSREAEGKAILKFLPGARSVAFFPLWDSHKERWFAGSAVWTTDPTRILDPEEDLTYLASFGSSIMAEISRLNALVSSQIKNSFVSSISHELRSPLHGVLASVEFLQDSPLNDLQHEMVSIINSCGRTLLDTINHVLDFSKLKRSQDEKGQERKKSKRHKHMQGDSRLERSQSLQRAAPVDIRVLTEEVLEGTYMGSEFGKGPRSLCPMIIINLEWRPNWGFTIDPGAWRRLIMNIFGNALKYTEAGFIRVSLRSRDNPDSPDGIPSSTVILTVSDSGKGISKEFLNHHIYTPFAQEDALAAGSGLGLSIVRHIVNEFRASIDIDSEQDSGTEVRISIPLTPAKLPIPVGEQDTVSEIQKHVRGLDICLVGFDVFPDIVDEPTGILSVEAKRMFLFKDSFTALLKDWFGMKVVVAPTLDRSNTIVSFIMESTFNEMLSQGWLESKTKKFLGGKSILLVVCTKPYQSYASICHDSYNIIYVQQPIGPHKLANTLARSLPSILPSQETSASSLPIRPTPRRIVSASDPGNNAKSPVLRSLSLRSNSPEFLDTSTVYPNRNSAVSHNSSGTTDQSSSRYVLLVEDNAINLRLLVTCMRKLGVDYTTAENGLIAVQKYKETTRRFHLVFMDISMPVMDGVEASQKIRVFEKELNYERVPIVAITGAASESARQEAFSAGIDRFLTKPVSLKVIREAVDDIAPSL